MPDQTKNEEMPKEEGTALEVTDSEEDKAEAQAPEPEEETAEATGDEASEDSVEVPEDAASEEDPDESDADDSEGLEPETAVADDDTAEEEAEILAGSDEETAFSDALEDELDADEVEIEATSDAVSEEIETGDEVYSDVSDAVETPEPVIEAAPEPVAPPPPAPARRSAWPGIFGGVIAAALGFFAARSDVIDSYLPESLRAPDASAEVDGVKAALSDLGATVDSGLAAVNERVDGLPEPTPPADLSPMEAMLADLAARIDALDGQSTDMSGRIDSLEARPTVITTEADDGPEIDLSPIQSAIATLEARVKELEARPVPEKIELPDLTAEFDELRSSSETQQAEISRLLEEAATAEAAAAARNQAILAQAALSQMMAAFDSGEPFADALDKLAASGIEDIPQILNDTAADGIPTLASLQADIPGAARAALSTARQGSTEGEGLGGFFQRQLGMRSLAPREGDDPDAVLSRVEAAVRSGDLSTALGETETLSDAAKSAMSDWTSRATTRVEAVTAAQDISQSLNSEGGS